MLHISMKFYIVFCIFRIPNLKQFVKFWGLEIGFDTLH